ncbi:MAG: sulfatase-like hydrolase/transferase [Kiritimatiellales bacterium]|nr:sulfatase-like hydrolase/transferase [Kiritimatiellales bacterium]
MKRRHFIQVAGGAVSFAAFGGSRFSGTGKPCNVLIVHTDEHNFRTLGCYRRALAQKEALMWGTPVVETPYIDSIADRGLVADAFYCASPICGPSRASFISGLYPMDTGVIENDVRIHQDIETFATALERAGYVTGYVGKWHLDGLQDEIIKNMAEKSGKPAKNMYAAPEFYNGWVPSERGMGFADNRFMFDCWHGKKIASSPDGGHPTMFPPSNIGDEKTFMTDWLADRTAEFIEQHKSEPFCCMVSFPDPHGQDLVREPYLGMYKGAPFKVPYTGDVDPATAPAWGKPKEDKYDDAAYFGMVKCIDDNVGKLLGKLDKLGLTDRTIVIFTSDHGDMRGEHGRQNKGVPYEASARIPFVIAAPGLIPPGIRTDVALNTVDFKPTLLGLLGVPAEKPSEGRDASAVLRGEPVSKDWNNLIFSRSPGVRAGSAWLMATDGRYKLVASPVEPLWLMDLRTDPAELVNRAKDPELSLVRSRMAKALLNYAEQFNDPNLPMGRLRGSLESAME